MIVYIKSVSNSSRPLGPYVTLLDVKWIFDKFFCNAGCYAHCLCIATRFWVLEFHQNTPDTIAF
ncbi:hypothetical protein T05_1361 [Trichinella murrelli]|uniref:Uncharacterized protein n=1 Tax=Trichinella murrelli TaxID=144512 RepID=A0A0V0SQ58_9BILA|nr:hypothetical protein T05_1361 [Trichinella murrelli]